MCKSSGYFPGPSAFTHFSMATCLLWQTLQLLVGDCSEPLNALKRTRFWGQKKGHFGGLCFHLTHVMMLIQIAKVSWVLQATISFLYLHLPPPGSFCALWYMEIYFGEWHWKLRAENIHITPKKEVIFCFKSAESPPGSLFTLGSTLDWLDTWPKRVWNWISFSFNWIELSPREETDHKKERVKAWR